MRKQPLHLQRPETQRTVASTDKTITMYLDHACHLLIKPARSRYPYPSSAADTLALANMLMVNYKDIAEEAKRFNGVEGKKSSETRSYCQM